MSSQNLESIKQWAKPIMGISFSFGAMSLATLIFGAIANANAISATSISSDVMVRSVLRLGVASAYLMYVPVVNISLALAAFIRSVQLKGAA